MMEILDEIIYKYANIVDNADVTLEKNTDLVADLGYDSISAVRLIIELESVYCIEINDISNMMRYGVLKRYVESHSIFARFYKDYLLGELFDKVNGCEIMISDKRDMPINKRFYYSIIMTDLGDKRVISCSHNMVEIMRNRISDYGELCESVDKMIDVFQFEGCSTRKMLRMLWDQDYSITGAGETEIEYEYISDLVKVVAKLNGTIIAYAKISDVINGVGNIVVYTDEEYRNRGIATSLLLLLLEKCENLNICPMYVVDEKNVASLNLAKKIGFSVVSEEVMVSREG